MRRIAARTAMIAAAGAALFAVTGGVAAAETPVWLLPGVDAGQLLGPTTQLPEQALAPVFDLITT